VASSLQDDHSSTTGGGERAERKLVGEAVKILEGTHAGSVGFVVARVGEGLFTVGHGVPIMPRGIRPSGAMA
jgi:hypothetical protein